MTLETLPIEIQTTREFNPKDLEIVFSDNYERLEISISPYQMMYKSAGDVPIWIKFVADFAVWKSLAVAAGATVSTLVTTDLYKFAKKVFLAKINGDPKAKVLLSIPFPTDRNSCVLEITTGSEEEIAGQIDEFGKFSLLLQAKLKELDLENRSLASPILVQLVDGGVLRFTWSEFPQLQRFEETITLDAK